MIFKVPKYSELSGGAKSSHCFNRKEEYKKRQVEMKGESHREEAGKGGEKGGCSGRQLQPKRK